MAYPSVDPPEVEGMRQRRPFNFQRGPSMPGVMQGRPGRPRDLPPEALGRLRSWFQRGGVTGRPNATVDPMPMGGMSGAAGAMRPPGMASAGMGMPPPAPPPGPMGQFEGMPMKTPEARSVQGPATEMKPMAPGGGMGMSGTRPPGMRPPLPDEDAEPTNRYVKRDEY